jgi:hypothetical protein
MGGILHESGRFRNGDIAGRAPFMYNLVSGAP